MLETSYETLKLLSSSLYNSKYFNTCIDKLQIDFVDNNRTY
jgi:hypothetical protein